MSVPGFNANVDCNACMLHCLHTTDSSDSALVFWSSDNVSPVFQRQDGIPYLHTSLPAHNRFLRFTSGATPADIMVASTAAKLLQSMYILVYKYWWGSSPG